MTKAELIKYLEPATDDARVALVDAAHLVIDVAEVHIFKAGSLFKTDEIQFFRERP
jgi:hypothetical protein